MSEGLAAFCPGKANAMAKHSRADPRRLPNVTGMIRGDELVRIITVAGVAGGISSEAIIEILRKVTDGFPAWYAGAYADLIHTVIECVATIAIGIIAGRKVAKSGEPATNFVLIDDIEKKLAEMAKAGMESPKC